MADYLLSFQILSHPHVVITAHVGVSLLRRGNSTAFPAFCWLLVCHPCLDKWLELRPQIFNVEGILANDHRFCMYGFCSTRDGLSEFVKRGIPNGWRIKRTHRTLEAHPFNYNADRVSESNGTMRGLPDVTGTSKVRQWVRTH